MRHKFMVLAIIVALLVLACVGYAWGIMHVPITSSEQMTYYLAPAVSFDLHWNYGVIQRLQLAARDGPETDEYTLVDPNNAINLINTSVKSMRNVRNKEPTDVTLSSTNFLSGLNVNTEKRNETVLLE